MVGRNPYHRAELRNVVTVQIWTVSWPSPRFGRFRHHTDSYAVAADPRVRTRGRLMRNTPVLIVCVCMPLDRDRSVRQDPRRACGSGGMGHDCADGLCGAGDRTSARASYREQARRCSGPPSARNRSPYQDLGKCARQLKLICIGSGQIGAAQRLSRGVVRTLCR